jgi:class 3 adenylate cyclase/tetratricopeptide (TPR) repeat protein
MHCTGCGTDNREGRKFCAQCGQPLKLVCPACGAHNEPGEKFCGDCGAALAGHVHPGVGQLLKASSKAPEIRVTAAQPDPSMSADGERKTVTALFADIKGSTELMEDLDPEEAQALIDPALQLMIEAVRRYDGYIVQSTGDGIFALFGAPVAREDHPQRALHAALRMQAATTEYAAKLRAEGRAPIEIRVGVNTGEVVVRSIQTGERTEYTPIGHTTNLASRLQAIAPTGSVVLSGETARLVAGYFELMSLGPVRVKGLSELVTVYEVVKLGPLRTRLEASAIRGLTKLCGRRTELDSVKQRLELARNGHGQVLAAAGDAGVGKSRLFYEFKAAASDGCMVLEAFAVSHGKGSPYLPVIQLLDEYFGIIDSDDLRRRREKVGGKILMLDRTLEDTLPYLFTLIGIQEGDDPLARMDPQIRRRRTLEAIRRILLRESLNQPLILVFEDLHWIDGGTQALLDLMVDSIENARILMLVNYRPEYNHRWTDRGYVAVLELQSLPAECAEELLSTLLGPSASLAGVKHLIIERTEGNPFFIEEMVRVLFEQGILERNGEVTLTRALAEVKIPSTVQGIIAARIDRLPPAQKELLQTVAVLGMEFTLSLARDVVSVPEQLQQMLSELQVNDFIYEEPEEHDTRYLFKHVLTQEVAYGSLLGERRRLLHERAARAIETVFAGRLDDYLADLANHYTRSGNVRKAVHYLELAGRQAARRAAYPEAVEHLTAGLKLLNTMPADEERDRREIEMRSALAQFLIPLQGPASEEVRQSFDRARELCGRLGDVESLFWVVFGLQFNYMLRLELETARDLGIRQLMIAERRQRPAMLMAAYVGLAQTLVLQGEFTSASEFCERALALPTQLPGYPLADVGEPGPLILAIFATVLLALGYPSRAMERGREALVLARHAGPYSLALALNNMAQLCRETGDITAVLENVEALEAIANEHGFSMWAAQATLTRGRVLIVQGQIEEAIAQLRIGVAIYEASGAVAGFWKISLADALGRSGAPDEGLKLIAEVSEQTERTRLRVAESFMYLVEAGLHLRRGGPQAELAAEASLRKSIEVSRRQSAKMFELRATTGLARLLAKQGRRDEAGAMMAEVYGWFTEGFDTADLKDAKALLTELNR